MITLTNLKKHIKKCKKRGIKFNFLGLVENNDLTSEVEKLFKFVSPSGYVGYDWVNGNQDLKNLCAVDSDGGFTK